MNTVPLRHLADIRTSSVDKKAHDGEVPIRLCNYVDAYRNDRVHPEMDLMAATATSDEVERFRLLVGDSVVTKDSEDPSDIGISAYVDATSDNFVCGYHLAIVRPRSDVVPRFLNWAIRGREVLAHWSSRASGMTRYGLGLDGIKSAPIHLLEADEQLRVADFLDHRIAGIDRIIAARRKQIARTGEQFRALLEETIWSSREVMPLKHLLTDVTSGPRGWGDLVSDEGTSFVRIGNLSPLGIELKPHNLVNVVLPEGAEAVRASLRPGDVLLSITAAFGEVAVWRQGSGTFSQHVARLRPIRSTDSDWIAWALQTTTAHDQYRLQAYGGTKIGMGLDHVRNMAVPNVHEAERPRAASEVDEAWMFHSNGVAALRRSIDLLAEYKTSLITAAVTGELDVTTAGSGLPA